MWGWTRTGARTPVILLLATLLAACVTTERPAAKDAARQRDEAIALPAAGAWQNGDERITFTTAPRDSLTVVTEQILFGTDGTARRTIELAPTGAVRTYTESRSQTAQASDRSPTRLEVELTLAFAGDSAVTRRKRVDGTDAPVRDYEIDAARKHVADLLAQFRPAGPTPPTRP
ncbi:MAG: hypothetical protein K2R93_00735 [Gemmatimonadaceae bacterium]|nr:hypothetical protein [Gemmatimonadaceae bacterium]